MARLRIVSSGGSDGYASGTQAPGLLLADTSSQPLARQRRQRFDLQPLMDDGDLPVSDSPTFDYYISPSASPSTDGTAGYGTLSQPWSLNAINTQGAKYAGKRVGIIGGQGTYNCLSIYIAANGGSTLAPNRGSPGYGPPAFIIAPGTSAAQTYIGSSNSSGNYQARLAVLDGGSTSLSQSSTVNPGANAILGAITLSTGYITIDGLVFQNNQYNYVSVGSETSVSPTARAPGILVENCNFGGSGTLYNSVSQENPTFLTLYACSGAVIQNNLLGGAVDDSTDRFEAFEQWATTGTIFQYNSVIVGSGTGAYGCAFIKNVNNSQATIRYNYFQSANAGMYGWDLSGTSADISYFYNNIVVSADYAFYTPGEAMTDANSAELKQIYNNTFVASGGAWANCGLWQRSGAATCAAFNNILVRTGAAAAYGDYSFSANAPALSDYNLFPATPSLGLSSSGSDSSTPTRYSSILTWAAALPSGCTGKDAHSILGAPTFVGGSPTLPAQAYQLAAGSLGAAAGSTNGQTSGSPVDMGAWGGADVNTGQAIAQIGCNFTS